MFEHFLNAGLNEIKSDGGYFYNFFPAAFTDIFAWQINLCHCQFLVYWNLCCTILARRIILCMHQNTSTFENRKLYDADHLRVTRSDGLDSIIQ